MIVKNIIKSKILSKNIKTQFKHHNIMVNYYNTTHYAYSVTQIAKIFKLLVCTIKSLGNLVDILSNDLLND